jgi:hypothetical protein
MLISGFLQQVKAYGHDRLLNVSSEDGSDSFWVSALEPEHFAGPGDNTSLHFSVGARVRLEVSLKYVTAFETRDDASPLGLCQPRFQSAHTSVVGRIVEYVDEFDFILSLGTSDPHFLVEAEKVLSIAPGQVIAVQGELSLYEP